MAADKLPTNPLKLPMISRPPKSMVEALKKIGSATASGELNRLGFKRCTIICPTSWSPGKIIAGPTLTLQFMPKREDVYNDTECLDPEK